MPSCRVCKESVEYEQRFCAACGWPTGQLRLPQSTPISIPENIKCRRPLEFYNDGLSDIDLCLTIKNPPGVVFCLPEGTGPTINGRVFPSQHGARQVQLEFDPAAFSKKLGQVLHLEFTCNDAAPDPDKPISRQRSQWLASSIRRGELLIPIAIESSGKLFVEQEILIFTETREERDLAIWNQGGSPLFLRRIKLPADITLYDEAGQPVIDETLDLLPIPPLDKRIFRVNAAAFRLPEGKIIIESREGNTAEILLIRNLGLKQRSPFKSRYVVGIDFGTYKSAVYYRDLSRPNEEPHCITFEGKDNHPSSMFFRSAGGQPEFGWLYDSLGRTSEAKQHGWFLVEAVKLLLGGGISDFSDRDNDDLIANIQKTHRSPVELVRLFLNHLRGAIDEQTTVLGQPPDRRTVLSVPLLTESKSQSNGTSAAELQRQNTLEAACLAGFAQGELSTEPEPLCVATYLMANQAKYPELRLSDNDIVCIFDCGHGTTDISIVRMKFIQCHPEIIPLLHYGRRFAGLHIERELENIIRRRHGLEFDEYGTGNKDNWEITAFRRLLHIAKEDVSFQDSAILRTESLPNAEAIEITPQDVQAVVHPYLERMVDDLISRMSEVSIETHDGCHDQLSPNHLNWLFMVGGSSRIPYIQQYLIRRLLSNNGRKAVLAKDDDSALAVAKGASLLFDYQHDRLVPYEITLEISEERTKGKRIVAQEGSGAREGSAVVDIPIGQEITCYLQAKYKSQDYRVSAFSITGSEDGRTNCLLEWRIEDGNTLLISDGKEKIAIYSL
jgi:molecular chaperone DnaK (HSP70)